MSAFESKSAVSWITLLVLLAALCALAVLQYVWIGQISQAEHDRMRAGLHASVDQIRLTLYRDLARVCATFQLAPLQPGQKLEKMFLERAGGLPLEFVKRALLVKLNAQGEWQAFVFQPAPDRLTAVPWPAEWSEFKQQLTTFTEHLETASAREWHRRAWLMDAENPLLFRSAISVPAMDQDEDAAGHELLGYIVIELNPAYLQKEYFPDLIQRNFGGLGELGYNLAVTSGGQPGRVLYESAPDVNRVRLSAPDITVDLLGAADSALTRPRGPLIRPASPKASWRLSVQHRAGSLESAVEKLRRRNLAVSLGVFALLISSLALVLLSARRARQLAQLQVDFVAGVSHELRTPVAAVCMAADNLAEGIVDTPQQARQYGVLLRQQGRRLATMVEQTLLFASMEKQKPRYDLRPTAVDEIIRQALAEERPLIDAAHMTVEERIAPDLPLVLADPAALKQCTGNLLSNAVKYAAAGGWIGLRAEAVNGGVRVIVEDRGPGIDPAERPHLFEPFYRGAAARDAQVYGSGLGLSLVKRMMEAMGGRVSLDSGGGKGSAFTLHLQARTNHE